ncbi:MAG: DUF2231 domain-containing protein [Candidatus Neomarinimicrobiota bacterium]
MFPWRPETVHPLFVHFPIALLSTGWLFDVMGTFLKKQSLRDSGWWCLVFGVVSTLFTIPTGFLADRVTGHMADPFPLYNTHGVLQITSSVLFLILLVWRWKAQCRLPEKPLLYLYFGIGGLAVVLLFYGGHLGAQLAGEI